MWVREYVSFNPPRGLLQGLLCTEHHRYNNMVTRSTARFTLAIVTVVQKDITQQEPEQVQRGQEGMHHMHRPREVGQINLHLNKQRSDAVSNNVRIGSAGL